MTLLPLAFLALTAIAFVAAPILIESVETKLNALEERVEARNEILNQL